MANLIAKPLRSGKYRYRRTPQPTWRHDGNNQYIRIKDEDGNPNYTSGKPRTNSCFICRQYAKKRECTQWLCRDCGMPVCKIGRGREQTCLDEHLCSINENIGCGYLVRSSFFMPQDLLRYRRTKSMVAASKTKKKKQTPEQATPPPLSSSNRRRSMFLSPSNSQK